MDGDQTPEAPDRLARENRFERNVYQDVGEKVLWSFTASTRGNTVTAPDVSGALDLAKQLVTTPGRDNTVTASGKTSPLQDEVLDRLLSRIEGTWEGQFPKLLATLGLTFEGSKHTVTYKRKGNNAVDYASHVVNRDGGGNRDAGVQVFDGRAYAMTSTDGILRTVSRTPLDEFTVLAEVTRDGRLFQQITQVFSRDGLRLVTILRNADKVVTGIAVFNKVVSTAR